MMSLRSAATRCQAFRPGRDRAFVDRLPREEKPQLELRRLKVRAMIRFLFRSGVRVSELCALRRRDIDLTDGAASIYRAKGGKSRTVHFDGETATALTAYWSQRGDPLRGAGALPAFSGRDRIGVPGSAISPRTVEHIVAGLAEAAGIESDVTPHSFRHGLATELVRRRVRESTVQTILGHASPATTRIYVHKSAGEVADEYQDASGRIDHLAIRWRIRRAARWCLRSSRSAWFSPAALRSGAGCRAG